jgi:hypothetical protein
VLVDEFTQVFGQDEYTPSGVPERGTRVLGDLKNLELLGVVTCGGN